MQYTYMYILVKVIRYYVPEGSMGKKDSCLNWRKSADEVWRVLQLKCANVTLGHPNQDGATLLNKPSILYKPCFKN